MAFVNKVEKFVVEANILNLNNGESVDISNSITDINVKKSFIESSFPLVVVNMMVTEENRNIMRDNDIALKIKVSKYTDVNQESEQDTDSIVIEEVILNSVIRSYKKPYAATAAKTEEDNEDRNNQSDTIKLIPYQIIGIPEELIQKNKIVINQIYENAKMDDVLVNILSQVETGNLFMDPSDNIEKELSLLIPPLNVAPAIKYLQEVYGIYNAGMSLFFDFDGTYLTKMYGSSRQYANTLEIISVSANENNTNIAYTTPQTNEDGNVRLYLQVPPPFVSVDKISKDVLGQTTVFNSYDYNFDPVRRIYSQDTNNQKTRYYWNSFQNQIFEQSYITETLRSSEAISISMRNISPSYFRINTLYTVNTNNDYVNGEYTLTDVVFTIYTRDYRMYESIINLRLSKK